MRLGDLLIQAGYLTAEQLLVALAEQRKFGGRLGDILAQKGFCPEDVVARALAQQLRVPFVDLPRTPPLEASILKRVPHDFALQHNLLPCAYRREDNLLLVAVTNPRDKELARKVEQLTRMKVQLAAAGPRAIAAARSRFYGVKEEMELGRDDPEASLTDTQGITMRRRVDDLEREHAELVRLRAAAAAMPVPQAPPQAAPIQGVPMQGIPVGVPLQGVAMGAPVQGVPMQGVPMQGVPMQGVPMQGVPMTPPPGPAEPGAPFGRPNSVSTAPPMQAPTAFGRPPSVAGAPPTQPPPPFGRPPSVAGAPPTQPPPAFGRPPSVAGAPPPQPPPAFGRPPSVAGAPPTQAPPAFGRPTSTGGAAPAPVQMQAPPPPAAGVLVGQVMAPTAPIAGFTDEQGRTAVRSVPRLIEELRRTTRAAPPPLPADAGDGEDDAFAPAGSAAPVDVDAPAAPSRAVTSPPVDDGPTREELLATVEMLRGEIKALKAVAVVLFRKGIITQDEYLQQFNHSAP